VFGGTLNLALSIYPIGWRSSPFT